jgi:hypothetical protein
VIWRRRYNGLSEVRWQSRERAEQRIRTRAYFLWRQEGCPGDRAEAHWYQACEIEGHNPEDHDPAR